MGDEQYDLLSRYAMDVMRDHDDFRENIPRWYRERGRIVKTAQ